VSLLRPGRGRLAGSFFWLGALALALGVAVSYLPALSAGFIWDDNSNVTENLTLRDLGGLQRIWTEPTANQQYYPLTHTSFWVEYHLWRLDPFGYHLVNLSLHAAAALLLWRVLLLLEVPGAWLAAAIFALHPVQVESVAWITERKNTLSAVFFLGSAFAGISYGNTANDRKPGDGAPAAATRRRLWYVVCSGLFLCAVLAKSTASLLPVALGLLFWWKRGRVTTRDLHLLLPLALIGAAAGLNTAWLEQHHVGASGPDFTLTLTEKFLVAGHASWFYLGKILLPVDLSFIYPRWRFEAAAATAWLYPAAALAALAGLWGLRRRIGRGPLTAALYFGAMLFPALGFFKVYFMRYSYVQDHFQYLASIGPIVLLGSGLAKAQVEAHRLLSRRSGRERPPSTPILFTATALMVLLPLGVITWNRCSVYHDSETLWRDTLEKNPAAWMAHNNLGVILMEAGRTAEAAGHFRSSLKTRPDLAETWTNLGDALLAGGDIPQALQHYRTAKTLAPGLPAAHIGLGAALERDGRTAEARGQFEEALRLDPANPDACLNLARLRIRAGDTGVAAALLEDLLRRNPSLARAHTLYGEVLGTRGQQQEAEAHYREALRLSPRDPEAHLGLGALLAARGDLDAAAASFARAAGIKPDLAEAHYDLGKVLDSQGKTAEAVRHYRLALKANPAFAEAHNNLGVDLLLLGQAGEGAAHLREALRLDPGYREARVNLELSRLRE